MGMRTGEKGRSFEGIWGGRNYEALASAFGMGPRFYERALGGLVLAPGMKALDLGCGPGGLSFALGARSPVDTQIHGVDLSVDQLDLASRRAGRVSCSLRFHRCSMDELPFPDGEFDLVMTSMALHETPPEVRRRTVGEVARVLREGGRFLLVDWSRPHLGLWGAVWFPLVCWGERNRDNWNNVYPELCRSRDLILEEDCYLNSITRRQLFRKAPRPAA